MTWVYDYDLNLLNLFNTQQEMLKVLNLKRVRIINKYKETSINFKGFYFFSKEIDIKTKNSILNNRQFAKYNKAKLVWVTQDNKIVIDKPFTSMTSAANFLNLYRKSIAKYMDTNEMFHGYKFFLIILSRLHLNKNKTIITLCFFTLLFPNLTTVI